MNCQGCNEMKPRNELTETNCCKKLKCGQCANPCDPESCYSWLCCLDDIKTNTCFGICPENHFPEEDAQILLTIDLFNDEKDHDVQRDIAFGKFSEAFGNLENLTCLQKMLISEFEDLNDGNLKLRCVNPFKRYASIQ